MLSSLAPILLAALSAAANFRLQDAAKPEGEAPPCHPDPAAEDPNVPRPTDRKSLLLRSLEKHLRESDEPFFGNLVKSIRERLNALPKQTPPNQIFQHMMMLGDAQLREGTIPAAITTYQRCLTFAEKSKDANGRISVLKKLGLAYLRSGERQNCITRHNSESCIFPLSDSAVHVDKLGSENAAKCLTEALHMDARDMGALWLLNVAHMTLGTYPDGVPPEYAIPPRYLAAEGVVGKFHDIAPRLGLNCFQHAGGSILDDFNGDGRLDVLLSSMDISTSLKLFYQQPDKTFRNVTVEKGLHGQLGGLQLYHADVNNDGRLDILVQRGAWLKSGFGRLPNSLLIQQADGTFVDRTLEAGIEVSAPSQVAAFADIDHDGDLDVFLGYESQTEDNEPKYPSLLFKNRGDGTFEDVTASSGIVNPSYCKGAVFGDYDGDRLPDLYLSNLDGFNRLFHNRGDGTFEDVAIKLGVHEPAESFATWFFDYNNDGWLDLYVTNYAMSNRGFEIGCYYKHRTTGSDVGRLYENDQKGGFQDVTVERRLDRTVFPMGCNFGDVDNDGFQDIYLATGDPDLSSLWPNQLWRNDRGKQFLDVTTSSGTGHLQKGHGVSFGDFDEDGDQDFFVEVGGAVKDDAFWSVFFENPGHGNHWLTVRLVGRQSNRFGVGARIRAQIEEPEGVRDVYAFVGSNSSFGGNSLQQEMGLGKALRLLKLEVYWPTTDVTQSFENVSMDRIVVIEEGNDQLLAPASAPQPGS